jgi:hypothetical protein
METTAETISGSYAVRYSGLADISKAAMKVTRRMILALMREL